MLQHRLPDLESRYPTMYRAIVVAGCIAIAAALRALIDPVVAGVPFITFFPAVAVTAYLAGLRAGAVTMIVGGLLALYFWVPPFGSFALELSSLVTVTVYVLLSGLILALIHRLRAALARARAAEKKSSLYAREMLHRTSNLVSLVQAVASMTFKNDGCPEEQRRLFNERLVALGKALASPMSDAGAQDVYELLRAVLLPFGDHIHISGRPAAVTGETAASLALIYHELATNAVKYGALSVEGGKVNLVGTMEGEDLLLEWRETGGPAVDPSPERRGFGSRLLTRSLSREAGAVEVTFEPRGLVASVTIKAARLVQAEPSGAADRTQVARPIAAQQR